MNAALSLSIVLLIFPGITKAGEPEANATQVLIQAKFIEITEQAPGPLAGAALPAPLNLAKKVPGIVGTLTDPQFQVLIRDLNQRKGVDLLAAPMVTTRVGQQAKIECIQEYIYKDEAGERAVRNVGVTLTVLPKKAVADQLDLLLAPQFVEFDGFVAHENGWDEPIFKERKATERVEMTSGQTIIFELDPKTDKQIVEVEDEAGHIVSSKTMLHKRRTLVFVTAVLIDPATGKPRVFKDTAD